MASCNGTCWAVCVSECSLSCWSSGSGPGASKDTQYYPSSGVSCSCGSDCAGCGGCKGGCSGCTGDCTGCSGSCGGSCSGTCTGDCKGQCTGSCKTGCQGDCKGQCFGSCNTKCTNTCGHLCNSTCVSDIAVEAQAHLKTYNEKIDDSKYIYDIQDWMDENFTENHISHLDENIIALDWLDKTEINYLLQLLQEEGRRRKLRKVGAFSGGKHPKTGKEKMPTKEDPLSKEETIQIGILDKNGKVLQIESGDFIMDEIKELNNLLLTNADKSIDISTKEAGIGQNQIIKRKAGEAIIQKALSAWNETININTFSDSKGIQTVG